MTDAATRAHPSLDELRAEAIEWGRKPRLRGVLYTTEHIVRAMRAYGWTLIVGGVGQPLVYLLGLAVGLAALIQAPIADGTTSVSYLVFVAPALLASAAITVGIEEYSYPVAGGFMWRRYYYGFNASPLSSGQIAAGVMIGGFLRMLFVASCYYVLIWIFGAVPDPATGWLAIPAGVLGGLAFGMPMLAFAASITHDQGQFAMVQRFVFMPMFLFSGTFYPLAVLPVWLQWIGWISPLWHASELGRAATYGHALSSGALAIHLGYLLILGVGGFVLARSIFIRRLAK